MMARDPKPRRVNDAAVQALAEDALTDALSTAIKRIGFRVIVGTCLTVGGLVWGGAVYATNERRDIAENRQAIVRDSVRNAQNTQRIEALERTAQAMDNLKAAVDSLNHTLRGSRSVTACTPIRPCP